MFTPTFVKQLTLILLVLAVVTACTGPTEPDRQIEIHTATLPPAATDTSIPAPTETPAATVTAVSPTAVPSLPTADPPLYLEKDHWSVYQNEFYAYRVSYPPEAELITSGVMGVASDSIPEGMSAEEYQAQLEHLYPDDICLFIHHQEGFVAVWAPLNNGGQFTGPCHFGGIGAYEIVEKAEEIHINGQAYTAVGQELWQAGETDAFRGGFFAVSLADGTQITYGSYREDLAYDAYLTLLDTLRQIAASYHATGTAVWPTLPGAERGDVSLPLASWIMPGEGPVPGTRLSYALSTGEEAGTHGDGDWQNLELATASFAAGEPVAIRVDSMAITAFRAQIMEGHVTGGRPIYSLPAAGQIDGNGVVFTLTQPGYDENQFLRLRLDFTAPVSGYVEYAWRLIPDGSSGSLLPAPVAAADLPACTLPTTPPAATATPAADPAWARLLQETAPETLARQADLIVMGTVDSTTTVRRTWLASFAFGSELGIVTDTAVQISCTLRGTTTGPSVTVRTEGGCLGGDEMGSNTCMVVSHGAQLTPGQQVILFLQAQGPEYVTVRQQDGRYGLQTTPETYRIFAEDGMYVLNGDEAVATPRHVYALAELLLRIASVEDR